MHDRLINEQTPKHQMTSLSFYRQVQYDFHEQIQKKVKYENKQNH